MSAHALLNLINELGKRDKMRGLPSILSLFIPHHTLVARYYVIPFGVCPSVRPSVRAHHFRSIT